MNNTNLTPAQIIASDPFAQDANLDLSGYILPSKTSDEELNQLVDKHGFNQVDFKQSFKAPSVEEMLSNPETREELAKIDPNFHAAYADEQIDAACAEFRRRNPDYLCSEKNLKAITQTMAVKLLGKDFLSDDDAETELYETGHWTAEHLTNAYRYLLRRGLLEVPKGTFRELTNAEQTQLIAQIRMGELEEAVVNYVSWSTTGSLDGYNSPSHFLSENPQLASKAAEFVFIQHRAGTIDLDDFRAFKAARLRGQKILTVDLINRAYDIWKKESKRSFLFPNHTPEPEPQFEAENYAGLTDDEVRDKYQAALRDAARVSKRR
jgi:hypothetical protein